MLSPAEVGYDLTRYAQEWQSERLRLTRTLALRVAQKASSRAIHDIRVTCRRLREAIAFFQGVPEVPPLSDVGRAARRMARAVGRLRELDVSIKRLRDLDTTSSREADRVKKDLLAALQRQRRNAARKRRTRIVKRAVKLQAVIAENLPLRVRPRATEVDAARESELRAFVEARVAARRVDVENLFDTFLQQGDKMEPSRRAKQLHRIRVAIKHWRYTSEIARAIMPRVLYRPLAAKLKNLQELGGRSQDFTDLAKIVEKELLAGEPTPNGRRVLAKVRSARTLAANEFFEALRLLRPSVHAASEREPRSSRRHSKPSSVGPNL